MPKYPELAGCVVLITGGANGIGAAMVRAFAAAKSRVYFCDVDAKAGRALARELSDATFATVDLTVERGIRGWVADVASRHSKIHVLVNNAASDPRIPLPKTTAKDWDDMFARNLRSYFLTAREASKFMPPGASIVNFGSITFHIAPAAMTAYVSTKGGVLGLTRSLARELGPRRIRVNTISPGWIMTERQLRQYVTPAVKRLIRRSQCIPDLIQPEDIAEIALYLASHGSSAITGQEILADRGWQFS